MIHLSQRWNLLLDTIRHGPVPDEGPRAIPASGAACVDRLLRLDFRLETILDLGSGNGRLLVGLAVREVPFASYMGWDVIPECVAWCQQNLAPEISRRCLDRDIQPTIGFWHLNKQNAFYNPDGDPNASYIDRLPRRGFDSVVLSSVLTHCGTPDAAEELLDAADAACAPGGKIFTSWFASPPNAPHNGWFLSPNAPHNGCDRTVFTWRQILKLLAGRNLVLDHLEEGETPAYHDQLILILRKPH